MLRLVVAEDVLPVERLVVLLPVERLVLPLCVLREVRSFCAKEERLAEVPAERLTEALEDLVAEGPLEDLLELEEIWAERLAEEPPDRLMEEEPREVVCEEDDREAVEEPPERRDWASASGAAIIAIVMKSAAMELIILLMALSFKS